MICWGKVCRNLYLLARGEGEVKGETSNTELERHHGMDRLGLVSVIMKSRKGNIGGEDKVFAIGQEHILRQRSDGDGFSDVGDDCSAKTRTAR